MKLSWKDSIYLQREQLARMLHGPMAQLADRCSPIWGDRERLNAQLMQAFSTVPHCAFLYCVGSDGVQICDNISK
jgi:hypothetical protein